MDGNHPLFMALCNILSSLYRHSFELAVSFLSGVIAYALCGHFMQPVRMKLLERRICGIDINKTTPEKRKQMSGKPLHALGEKEKQFVVPEALGILSGAVYLCVLVVELAVAFGPSMRHMDGAITTITVMLFLGFVDDVLDVRWRHKLLLSAIGSLPLILTYDGSLSIAIPKPLSFFFDTSFIYLGVFYLVYLILLCVFCTNSINILAGINGIEVSQSVLIALACIAYNIIQLRLEKNDDQYSTAHALQAISLLMPFVGVSMALWRYNKYPASIFVGDSYTYFAGTVLSVSSVTGHYSKTLLLFFTPQVINFIISLPQLFHIIPCPRHRIPRWDEKRDTLQNSGNYTLLNLILWMYGDMHERVLTNKVAKFQVYCCILALVVRYVFASYLYDDVR